MAVIPYKVLKKSFTIDNFTFSLGITRILAVEGFRKFPKYWELLNEKGIKDLITNKKDFIENLEEDNNKTLLLMEFGEKSNYYKKEIVEYLLPQMLKYGETNIEKYSSYEDYAKALLEFCKDCNILEDYTETPTEEEIQQAIKENPEMTIEEFIEMKTEKGFYTVVMELINLGFTQGNSPLKPKTKIMAM